MKKTEIETVKIPSHMKQLEDTAIEIINNQCNGAVTLSAQIKAMQKFAKYYEDWKKGQMCTCPTYVTPERETADSAGTQICTQCGGICP